MIHLLIAVASATPMPTPPPEFDANSVTPTVVGFIATLLVAVAVIFLLLDMNRRIRRVRYRAEVTEKLDAERAATSENATTTDISTDAPEGSSPER